MIPRTRTEVEVDVVKIVLEYAPNRPEDERRAAGLDFIDDLDYHSLAIVEMALSIEDHFELEPIMAEDVEHIRTAGQLADYVHEQIRLRPMDTEAGG